jgi:hypothetical protein
VVFSNLGQSAVHNSDLSPFHVPISSYLSDPSPFYFVAECRMSSGYPCSSPVPPMPASCGFFQFGSVGGA